MPYQNLCPTVSVTSFLLHTPKHLARSVMCDIDPFKIQSTSSYLVTCVIKGHTNSRESVYAAISRHKVQTFPQIKRYVASVSMQKQTNGWRYYIYMPCCS